MPSLSSIPETTYTVLLSSISVFISLATFPSTLSNTSLIAEISPLMALSIKAFTSFLTFSGFWINSFFR